MRVILVKDIKGVGRAREIVEVSDGYAKNMLLPKGLAKLATPAIVSEVNALRANEEKIIEDLKKTLSDLQKISSKDPLVLKLKVGPNNQIFHGVHAEDIQNALFSRGFMNIKLDKLDRPIKQLGRHKVKIRLPKGIAGEIDIEVKPL